MTYQCPLVLHLLPNPLTMLKWTRMMTFQCQMTPLPPHVSSLVVLPFDLKLTTHATQCLLCRHFRRHHLRRSLLPFILNRLISLQILHCLFPHLHQVSLLFHRRGFPLSLLPFILSLRPLRVFQSHLPHLGLTAIPQHGHFIHVFNPVGQCKTLSPLPHIRHSKLSARITQP